MGMQEVLRTAIESVQGATLAGVVGTDGLGVEMLLNDVESDFNAQQVEIELGGLAAAAAGAAGRLNGGELRDLIVETERVTYVASQILPGYYAVLGVGANGNLGRARFALRQMTAQLRETM